MNLIECNMIKILFAVEIVTAEETRKVLIGEDPQQETRPKKRLVKFILDFLAFIIIMASIKILNHCIAGGGHCVGDTMMMKMLT